MDESHAENLIERGLSAQRPRREFRDRLLGESTAVAVGVARARARWRKAGLALAAVLVGAVSFLGGRLSAPRSLTPGADPAPRVAAEREGVTVPEDLIAWLNAARLFKQLGMEDRMARAVERASKLLPPDAVLADRTTGRTFGIIDDQAVAARKDPVGLAILPRLYEPTRNINGIVAHSLGGHRYASERD